MPITWTLAMLILVSSCCSLLKPRYFGKMLLHPYSIVHSGAYYRLWSADFVHNDLIHLMLNELMLIFVCGKLEMLLRTTSRYGSYEYLLIYFTSMMVGAIAVTIIYRNEFSFSGAGASGSILGCLFCYTLLRPEVTAFYLPFIGAVQNRYDGLLYMLGLAIYKIRGKNSAINHELHFFGAMGGIMITFLLFPQLW